MLATRDLQAFLAELRDESPEFARDAIAQVLPELLYPYTQTAAELAAVMVEDLRAESGKSGTFYASADVAPMTREAADRRARWAVGALVDQSLDSSLLTRLQGISDRIVFNGSRETVLDNTARDHVAYQRMAAPGCCEFCAMLASRGSIYTKETGQRRGKGQTENKYHDNCKCVLTAIYPGTEVAEIAELEKKDFQARYDAAVKHADGATDQKSVLAAMRELSKENQ